MEIAASTLGIICGSGVLFAVIIFGAAGLFSRPAAPRHVSHERAPVVYQDAPRLTYHGGKPAGYKVVMWDERSKLHRIIRNQQPIYGDTIYADQEPYPPPDEHGVHVFISLSEARKYYSGYRWQRIWFVTMDEPIQLHDTFCRALAVHKIKEI